MARDKRYNIVKKLIMTGSLHSFEEFLEVLPASVLTADLRMHNQTFAKQVQNPELFTYRTSIKIAALLEVEPKLIVDFIFSQIDLDNKARKKSK
jgi:hypothetical protein